MGMKERPEFKLIIMSATIEPQVFIDNLLANGVVGGCHPIEVPGVTYPIRDVWWEGEPWEPTMKDATLKLASTCINIYKKVGFLIHTTDATYHLRSQYSFIIYQIKINVQIALDIS